MDKGHYGLFVCNQQLHNQEHPQNVFAAMVLNLFLKSLIFIV